MRLEGRNALVTGGATGIGRAIAARLLSEGARVALTSRRTARAREAALAIDPSGARAAGFALEASDRGSIRDAVRQSGAWLGPIDIVVNNAGISGRTPVDEDSEEPWRRILAVNLDGPYFVVRDALPLMRPGAGRIINISSVLGKYGVAARGAYCASKHGLIGLTRALAPELVGRGITVNAICPGPIETNLRANSMEILGPGVPDMMNAGVGADPSAWKAIVPVGRRGTVEEIAALAAFLASQSAGYITGAPMVIDGGWTAR